LRKKLVIIIVLSTLLPLYASEVVTSTPTLVMLVKPILEDWKVVSLMPPGASPLFWKPTPSQIQDALEADIFIQTAHWPYEIQIAKKRYSKGFVNIPNIIDFVDPARELMETGYVILKIPNNELNPHGWWIYAPNAFQLISLTTFHACLIVPSSCNIYIRNALYEIMKSKEVINRCSNEISVKRVVTIMPVEEYAVANFGIETLYIIQVKGTMVSGVVLHSALKYLKEADALIISEVSDNLPITKIIVRYAKIYHKPIYKLHVFWGEWNSYHEYLEELCRGLGAR